MREKERRTILATDTLVFREIGKPSFSEDPRRHGVHYCGHCRSWHAKLRLDTGTEFCSFCNTTHHSRACGAGLKEKCKPGIDLIHQFLTSECLRHQKLDLSFCGECNCHHSKQGWKICLIRNRPKWSWSERRKLIWKLRWSVYAYDNAKSTFRKDRSLFNRMELARIIPFEYPFSTSKFEHHRDV